MDRPLFSPSANTIAKASILGALVLVIVLFLDGGGYMRSDYYTGAYETGSSQYSLVMSIMLADSALIVAIVIPQSKFLLTPIFPHSDMYELPFTDMAQQSIP